MEPFRFTGQAIAFLAVMGAIAVIVAIAAPFGSIALAAAALAALGAVLVKALLRARAWWPLTAVEGTVALSSSILVVAGAAVIAHAAARLGTGQSFSMMMGWPFIDTPRIGETRRSVRYGDPDAQQRLKDALRGAGIPFSVQLRDGDEFITWAPEHNAAAEAVIDKTIKGKSVGDGRNAHFPDPAMQKQFTDWLTKKGTKHEVIRSHGQDFVVWDPAAGDLVRQFMEGRGADCKDRVAGKGGAARC